MKFCMIAFSRAGIMLGKQIEEKKQIRLREQTNRQQEFSDLRSQKQIETVQLFGWHKYADNSVIPFYHTKSLVEELWNRETILLFIGAVGIAVRSIAPFITDKTRDPAVLVMDDTKKFVISLLSGHLGGANEYCMELAEEMDAVPVITTATDRNQCFAVDLFAKKNQLCIADWHTIKEISGAILEGKQVGFLSEYPIKGTIPNGLVRVNATHIHSQIQTGIVIASNENGIYFENECRLLPKNLVIGIGCKKGKTLEELESFVQKKLEQYELPRQRVKCIVSVDKKKEEAGILALCAKWNIPFLTYTAEQLNRVEGIFPESDFVMQTVGVSNVCERSACFGSHYGEKKVGRQVQDGMTLAIYEEIISILF